MCLDISAKAVSSLKDSLLVAFLIHVVLLSFNEAYKWWPVQGGQSLVALLPVGGAAGQQAGTNEFVGMN